MQPCSQTAHLENYESVCYANTAILQQILTEKDWMLGMNHYRIFVLIFCSTQTTHIYMQCLDEVSLNMAKLEGRDERSQWFHDTLKVRAAPWHFELSCLGVWGPQMVIILLLVHFLGINPLPWTKTTKTRANFLQFISSEDGRPIKSRYGNMQENYPITEQWATSAAYM